jgi:hypothetical protein
MTIAYDSTNAFANLLEKGFEHVMEASKTSLDMNLKYNAEVLEATRKAFNLAPNAPGLALFDVASKAFENYAELQKNILGILGEQGSAAAGAIRESGKTAEENLAANTTNTTNAFYGSVDRTAAAHKAVLDFAAKQNKQVVDAVKQQQGVAGTPLAEMAESVQHGMDALIEAQKKSLEVAASQLKSATKAKA